MAGIIKKIIGRGGDFIFNRSDTKALTDIEGEQADNKRQQLLAGRARRKRELNFVQTSDGRMKIRK